MDKKPKLYRDFIDCMVDVCNNGQGQISKKRILKGLWNANANIAKLRADNKELQNQYKINLFLQRLTVEEREILAEICESNFRAGIFETLKYLEEFEVEPFIEGYEGSPYHDFIGRVDKNDTYQWPEG